MMDKLTRYIVTSVPAAAADARAHAASIQPLRVNNGVLDCSGSGAGPNISFDADFSKVAFTLFFDPYAPELQFSLIGRPDFDLQAGLAATGSCTYSGHFKIVIPIPGTPVQVVLKPAFTFSAGGALGVDVKWSPAMTISFQRGRLYPNSDTYLIKWGAPKITPLGQATGDIFFGAEADLTLGGRIGVSAQAGPDFTVTLANNPTACLTVDAALKAQLSAFADVFVKHWSFALLSGTFWKKQLWSNCSGGGKTRGGASVTVTNPGNQVGTVGAPASLQVYASDTDGGRHTD